MENGVQLITEPYWWEGRKPLLFDGEELPGRVDVAVVGAGYTGLSAALWIVRYGCSVAVFDAGLAGHGASTWNGGICIGSLKPTLQELVSKYGRKKAAEQCAEAQASLQHLSDFIAQEGLECDIRKAGILHGAFSMAQYGALSRKFSDLEAIGGHKGHLIARSRLREEIGADAYVGGLLIEDSYAVHPARYFDGLLDRSVRAGAQVFAHSEITRIQKVNGHFVLSVRGREVTAENVVVATNGYTGEVNKELQRRLVPIASYMIATEELPEAVVTKLIPKRRNVVDSNRLLCYYRVSPDGKRILFGGRPAYVNIEPQDSAQRLKRMMLGVFPQLAGVRITHSWFGYIGYSFDRLPHIGELDGLYYASCYCGTGVAMSTWLGRKVAERLTAPSSPVSAFAGIEHPTLFLYSGKPWFLPIAQGVFQMQDWFGR